MYWEEEGWQIMVTTTLTWSSQKCLFVSNGDGSSLLTIELHGQFPHTYFSIIDRTLDVNNRLRMANIAQSGFNSIPLYIGPGN